MNTKEIYCLYSKENDITFVMMDTIVNGETTEVECIGFEFGEKDVYDIDLKYLTLKATF